MTQYDDRIDEAIALHDRAVSCRTERQYAEAQSLCRRSLRILEASEDVSAADIANVNNTLASAYCDGGGLDQAERLYRRSVSLMQDMAGDGDVERIRVQSLTGLA